VFLIVLSEQGYDQAFGTGSTGPYLSKTLPSRGELLANYYGVTQGELANQIALLSGQGPTPQTVLDCPTYSDVAAGAGCVYPATAKTLGDQLAAIGKTWRAYVEGSEAPCSHPQPGAAAPYLTSRDPFAYFHSVIDGTGCATEDVGLGQLATDLKSADATPAFAYIVPNRCHDGEEQPCPPGQAAGLAAADAWLRTIVPELQRSPAYRDGGLIAITFAEAPQTGPNADSSSCCNAPTYPNLRAPTPTPSPTAGATPTPTATTTPTATPTPDTGSPGGGRVGLLLLSPFVRAGTVNQVDSYNHFSLLRSIEDLFGLDHLGYAADPTVPAFDKAVYNGRR
jgi:hypothetical protein